MQPITDNLKTKVALAIGAILVAVLGAGAWINISIFTAEFSDGRKRAQRCLSSR